QEQHVGLRALHPPGHLVEARLERVDVPGGDAHRYGSCCPSQRVKNASSFCDEARTSFSAVDSMTPPSPKILPSMITSSSRRHCRSPSGTMRTRPRVATSS